MPDHDAIMEAKLRVIDDTHRFVPDRSALLIIDMQHGFVDEGASLEVAAARDLDLLTTPYVFNPDEAERMTRAGADIIVAHMGLTTKGTIGAETAMTLEDAAGAVTAITDAAKAVRDDVLVICHGGPIAEPEDARFIIEQCPGVDGFYGASSMERLPVETALTEQVRKFCAIELPRK